MLEQIRGRHVGDPCSVNWCIALITDEEWIYCKHHARYGQRLHPQLLPPLERTPNWPPTPWDDEDLYGHSESNRT